MRKTDINKMRSEYVGKEFGWLTVLDVYIDQKTRRLFFKCKCRCGNEVGKQYNKVISGHTKSCGCYRFSKEFANSLSDYWQANPHKVAAKSEKYIGWCNDNPDKVAARGNAHSEFYKEHPEVLEAQVEKRKQTFKNDPSIQEGINKKLSECWTDEKRAEFSEEKKKYYDEHPETCNKISLSLIKFYEENDDSKKNISMRNKKWREENPDSVKHQTELHRQWFDSNRQRVIEQAMNLSLISERRRVDQLHSVPDKSDSFSHLIDAVHPSLLSDLLLGKIKSGDYITTKCPVCGKYSEHIFGNIWRLYSNEFRTGSMPMCESCRYSITSSKYEQEIYEYISTFYAGEVIQNNRSILNGKELDLYYPEKKIAIEFNGDYWHNEDHKPANYHYGKFKECYDLGIILVSIFENDWINSKELILSYIKDLFSGVANSLSYMGNDININYPPPNLDLSAYSIRQDFYTSKDKKIHTCGTAVSITNSLSFLIDIAVENSLEYFINDRGDLEIKDKNICFHLANMLNGDIDAYERWVHYHTCGKRCVFVYPPYLNDINKVNVYKNILVYHCGFAKRIYARNTVVKTYPAVHMKRFFNENNIEGYRNAKTAYVLEDKHTGEPYMCYLIGHSYFGKGNYDCEIARGACKLGYQVVGGASKLWKHIINDNPNVNSIVYYCDRREYDQRSISHLMDSATMNDVGKVYTFKGAASFMNYWISDAYIDGKLWHRAGEYRNREPNKHKHVVDSINNGSMIVINNPGSFTNIFVRKGYHLDGMRVVKD